MRTIMLSESSPWVIAVTSARPSFSSASIKSAERWIWFCGKGITAQAMIDLHVIGFGQDRGGSANFPQVRSRVITSLWQRKLVITRNAKTRQRRGSRPEERGVGKEGVRTWKTEEWE